MQIHVHMPMLIMQVINFYLHAEEAECGARPSSLPSQTNSKNSSPYFSGFRQTKNVKNRQMLFMYSFCSVVRSKSKQTSAYFPSLFICLYFYGTFDFN